MPAPVSVNLAAADGGLEPCLSGCKVPEQVCTHLKDTLGVQTLDDLMGMFTKKTYEAEIKTAVEGIQGHQPLWVARLRTAYKTALAAFDRAVAQKEEGSSTAELEAPLHKIR